MLPQFMHAHASPLSLYLRSSHSSLASHLRPLTWILCHLRLLSSPFTACSACYMVSNNRFKIRHLWSIIGLDVEFDNASQSSLIFLTFVININRRNVLAGNMLRSAVTMPIKNFLLSLSLAPTCSSLYSRPVLTTGTLLNYQPPTHSPILDSSSGMTINCTFSIPVSWITRSLEPPHHSSHIAFIEDTDDMQHKVTCPTLQMYLRDGSRRGPDGPVACAPACFANTQLDHDPTEHYPCSTPLSRPHTNHTRQIAFDRQTPDPYLDTLNGHSSILEIDTDNMPLDNSDNSAFPATLATSAPW
jgi:hypothetical protein